ncbi:tRNA pseudouridine(55) synthase TruB [Acidimicrobiaceae bacterium]|nr:tRNA pseudouridine(55) synthase TruB [Acidimicrobiaceae bacterium]
MNYNSNFYLLNKPKSWTSQDLCTKFKKTYKFNKVGHSGTLDPNAEGLMLVATNSFTKLFDYIEDTSKSYYVKALLGYSSDTLDVDSDFKKTDNINSNVFEKEIQNFLNNLVGDSIQTPPIYSAIKVKGKRLYKYARQNIEVEIPKRNITVFNVNLISLNDETVEFDITVSKGTYIRSIVNDLGKSINTNAIVKELIRTGIGKLKSTNNNLITNVENLTLEDNISPLNWSEVIELPSIVLEDDKEKDIQNGQLLDRKLFNNSKKHIVIIDNQLKAIYEPFNNKYFKPDKVIV